MARNEAFRSSLAGMENLYGDGHSSERIVSVLVSVPLGEELLLKRATAAGGAGPDALPRQDEAQQMRIPLSSPEVTDADRDAVMRVLQTPQLSLGPKLAEFEEVIAGTAGVPYGVAVSSGTAGLHLCLRALEIGEGDEVILPSFTFIAAGNAVLYQRAKPVFVDIDPVTLNLDPGKLEGRINPRTRAIIVVHTFGHPADMTPILEIARKHEIPVIEDACEAIGAEYQGRPVGIHGRPWRICVLSQQGDHDGRGRRRGDSRRTPSRSPSCAAKSGAGSRRMVGCNMICRALTIASRISIARWGFPRCAGSTRS